MKNEREILRKNIIERIAIKKSIWGLIARDVKNAEDEEATLLMYYNQVKGSSVRKHLGEELSNDIIRYNVMYNKKPHLD